MVDSLNATQLKCMFLHVADRVVSAKEILCDADRNIGDGDHGIGMANGFRGVQAMLNETEFSDVYGVFSNVGLTMIRVMGGASGIIFGLLFLAGSKKMPAKPDLTTAEFSEIFLKGLEEIQAKGGAKLGDKTMIDALSPAVEAMKKSVAQNHGYLTLLNNALTSAEEGKDNSKNYIARFGKSKTLGERAIGFPDAGCVTITIIFSAMKEWAESNI